MTYRMRIEGPVWTPPGMGPHPFVGKWLRSYDPHTANGHGRIVVTDDPTKAKLYPDPGALLDDWKQQSGTVPTRPDDKPNRPLTAFTITVEKVEE